MQRVGGERGGAVRLHPALDQPVAHRRRREVRSSAVSVVLSPPLPSGGLSRPAAPGGWRLSRPVAREEPHDLIAVRVRVQPELLAQRLDFQRVLRRRELIGDGAGIEQQLVPLRRVCVGDRIGLLFQQRVLVRIERRHRREQFLGRKPGGDDRRAGEGGHQNVLVVSMLAPPPPDPPAQL